MKLIDGLLPAGWRCSNPIGCGSGDRVRRGGYLWRDPRGILDYIAREGEYGVVSEDFAGMHEIPITRLEVDTAIEIGRVLRTKGANVPATDLIISAAALNHDRGKYKIGDVPPVYLISRALMLAEATRGLGTGPENQPDCG